VEGIHALTNNIDVIMQNWNQKFYAQIAGLSALPLRYWQFLVYGLLALWAIFIFAAFLESFVINYTETKDPDSVSKKATSLPESLGKLVDLGVMRGWQLFGEPVATGTKEVLEPSLSEQEANAEETKLQLTLNGVASSADQQGAQAIITYKNKQDSYRVGEKLPIGNRVTISKILTDRVILNNKGSYESLFLYEEGSELGKHNNDNRAGRPLSRESVLMVNRTQGKFSHSSARRKQVSGAKSGSLIEAMNISMVRDDDGKTLGFKLKPKNNGQQFTGLGLKADDIVTRINDVSLQTPEMVIQAYQMLKVSNEARFTLLRDGKELELQVRADGS